MLKVILLTLLPLALAVQCPDSFLIDPCTCKVEPEGPHLFCDYLPSLKSLTDIFSRRFPSGDALHQLTLTRSKLAPLPNDVFHGKSFQIIELSANRYISFDESKILSSSQKTLRSLSIDQDTEDWNFNFANVANFAALTDLRVSGYNLKFIGSASKMPILTGLSLKSYLMMAPPQLADLPALQALDLDGNTIQTLSQHDFASVPSLKQVFLGHNKLVKINTSSIALHGPMQVIDLSSNMIDDIQPDSISGIAASTQLYLVNNNLRQLSRQVLEPIVKLMSTGSGRLFVEGNPLDCGCDMAWIMTDAFYLKTVADGRCVNGTKFTDLDMNFFNDC